MEYIELICVKEGSKLRVKISTPGYFNNANCQFPRDIRVEGNKYKVRAEDVSLIMTRGKWFYTIKKGNIEIINPNQPNPNQPNLNQPIQIYEDINEVECAICMSENKNTVFYPCGHYHTCTKCSNLLNNCPMCLKKITNRIDRSLIG
jgi:hypothetical protein